MEPVGERSGGVSGACLPRFGCQIVAYSPLGRGFLSGQIRNRNDDTVFGPFDFGVKMLPKIDENNFDKNLALVDEAKTIADVKGCTMAQLSLAWVHQQGEDVIPIPGTTKVKNLWENLEARDIVLSDEEMVKLDTIWTKDTYQSTHSTIYGN